MSYCRLLADLAHWFLTSFPERLQVCAMQVLGENVLLMRVLLEAVGAIARTLGLRFAATGGLLRTVLLPTLERLGASRCLSTSLHTRMHRHVTNIGMPAIGNIC